MNDEVHNQKLNEPEIEVLPVKTRQSDVPTNGSEKRPNIVIGTLNIFADPARGAFIEPIERRYWRHYHPDRPHGMRHMVVDVLLFAALVGLVAVNVAVYVGFGRSYLPGIELTITHEGALVSGGIAQYAIHYTNDNAGRLEDARLALRLPVALTEVSVTPENGFNRNTNTWVLGAIDPGGDALLTVRGRVLGSIGEAMNVGATLSYRPEGSRRGEQKLILDHTAIERSTLTTSAEGPHQHINGQSITLRLRYKNEGESATPPLIMTPTLPEGFTLVRTTPSRERGVFHIDRVPPGGEGVIVLDGVLDGRGQSAVAIPIAIAFVSEGRMLSQGDALITVPLFYPRVTTTLTIDTPSLRGGAETTYTIAYVNEEVGDALDVQFAVAFPDRFMDTTTFASGDGMLDGSIIRFTKARVPALALVKPGGKGTLTFTVATRQDIDARILFPDRRPRVTIPVTATYRLEPDVDTLIPSIRPTEFPVSAGLTLQSSARYFTEEGDQLGRGPLPPIVGKTTRYWIFWNVENTVSDVRAVVARGTLPSGVAWTGKMSVTYGDPVKFDPVTRAVTWNLDQVKRETGGIYPDVGAFFEVALTPNATGVGTYSTLLEDQRIEGQDTVTEERLTREVLDVTTELPHDGRAAGKGKVRE